MTDMNKRGQRVEGREAAQARAAKAPALRAPLLRAAFAALALALLSSCATPSIPLAVTPPLSALKDGRYEGSYDAKMVKATVAVLVKDGKIAEVAILSHDSSPIGKKGEAVAARVVAAQSLEVEAVAGATGSSRAILKAIENALAGAGPDAASGATE